MTMTTTTTTTIREVAEYLAALHVVSPEVVAAGGPCATDACEFEKSTLRRALEEEGLPSGEEETDALRAALAVALG